MLLMMGTQKAISEERKQYMKALRRSEYDKGLPCSST